MKLVSNRLLLVVSIILLFNWALSALKKQSKRNENLFPSTTNPDDDGEGSIFYLDRHNVDVGSGKVLRGFHLYTAGRNKIAYEFASSKGQSISGQTYQKNTPWGDTANEYKSIEYLGRHEVKCDNNDMIQQFQLIRNRKQIAYAYRCVKVKANECFETMEVEEWLSIDRSMLNLVDEKVLAPEGSGLNGFKFDVLSKTFSKNHPRKKYRYQYRYCKLQ